MEQPFRPSAQVLAQAKSRFGTATSTFGARFNALVLGIYSPHVVEIEFRRVYCKSAAVKICDVPLQQGTKGEVRHLCVWASTERNTDRQELLQA